MNVHCVEIRSTIGKARPFFDKNYTVTIIRVEYAYKIALKYDVNNNEETKQKENKREKVKLSAGFEFFVEGSCRAFDVIWLFE